jgi:DNA-binding transcriptional MocR family regulator
MVLDLVRASRIPLTDQIVDGLAAMIERRQLAEGTRLPSVRRLSRQLGVSAFTVVTAYDRLAARGAIEPRAGTGFFVARRSADPGLARIEAPPETPDTALSLARAALDLAPIAVPAGAGYLPPEWMADGLPPSLVVKVARREGALLSPCPAPGLPALREQLVQRLQQNGIPARIENVCVTLGATQAFDVILRALLAPGDAVVVEDPGYFVLFAQLARHGLRLLAVPREKDGPDLDALEELCRLHRPRAIFVQTLLHNPTGTTISPAKCHRLLTLAERHDALVIEDDAYGDLAEPGAIRLAQIDGLERVLHVGSFTKTLSPGFRVGFVAAPAGIVPRLIEEKLLAVLSAPALPEAVIAEALSTGRFRRHIAQLRRRLARARAQAGKALAAAGCLVDPDLGDGLFVWARVPESVDVDALVRAGREAGILLAKGALFSPSGRHSQHLRFNAVHASNPVLGRFLSGQIASTAAR